MKLQHIVLIHLKKNVRDNQLVKLSEIIENLPFHIRGVIRASCGFNYRTVGDVSYDYEISILFENRDFLDSYLNHPYHRRMADEYVHKMRDGNLFVEDIDICR